MIRPTWLVLLLALALGACGDDTPADQPDRVGVAPPADDPARTGAFIPPVAPTLGPATDVSIDDAALEKLFAMHRQVLEAGDDVQRAMALGAGTTWNYPTYAKALGQWRAMQEATRPGGSGAQAELDKLDRRLEELAAQVADATGGEKERLQQRLDMHKRMRPALAEHVEAVKQHASPTVKVLVERWKPRFDALETEFSKK